MTYVSLGVCHFMPPMGHCHQAMELLCYPWSPCGLVLRQVCTRHLKMFTGKSVTEAVHLPAEHMFSPSPVGTARLFLQVAPNVLSRKSHTHAQSWPTKESCWEELLRMLF